MLTADLMDIGIRLEQVPYRSCSWSDLWFFITYCQPRHRIYAKVHRMSEDMPAAALWSSQIVTNQLLAGLLHSSLLSMWAKGGGKGRKPKPVPNPFSQGKGDGRSIKGTAMRGSELLRMLYPDGAVGVDDGDD